jgi:Cd2+/Zn2+-exporting ATPase
MPSNITDSSITDPNLQTETFRIEGLDCPDCAVSLEKAIAGLPGVASAKLNFTAATLVVSPEKDHAVIPDVERVARKLGHRAVVQRAAEAPSEEPYSGWREWGRRNPRAVTTITGGTLLLSAFLLSLAGAPDELTALVYVASTFVSGYHAGRAGWTAFLNSRRVDMNTLMTIAAVGALLIGAFEEGAMVTFLFALGNLLESATMDRARQAIRSLMDLAPREATVLRNGTEERVPIETLQVGDHILVRPGERLPMDGKIVEGYSAINEAPVTGESLPVEKGIDDEVFAGTVNGPGALTIEVTRVAADNTLARLIQMVEDAQAQRAPSQRFVDRFAHVYTPIVVGLAALITVVPPLLGWGGFSEWLYRGLVLLIISCPCALVISTPVTVVSAIARAARSGVLIKGGAYLEQMGAIRVMAFDKTGTLTQGEPEVVDCYCAERLQGSPEPGCVNCQDLIAKAASVESRSEHPLARSIVRYAQALGVDGRFPPGQTVSATAGMGIEGRVDGHHVSVGSHAFLHRNGEPANHLCDAVQRAENAGHTILVIEDQCCDQRGYLAVSDQLRPAVSRVMADLRQAGIQHTVMLTGDNERTAERIASQAGVDEVRARLLPEDKVRAVAELEEEHGHLAMVGDGVNDAPAMARASVGIAMGAAGTDAALETADIALMADDLSRLPFSIRLSRKALRTIQINIALSLAVKGLFMALALAGSATLWMAVFADMGMSLLVTLNGLRMLGYRDSTHTDPLYPDLQRTISQQTQEL